MTTYADHVQQAYEEQLGRANRAEAEVERLRVFIAQTAREHCHCDLDAGPCSVCRARAEMVAHA